MSGYQLDPTQPQFSEALTRHIQQTIVDMLADPTQLPADFKSWLPQYLETNPPLLPISQIFGFSQSQLQVANFAAGSQTLTTSTFSNLGDGLGPAFDGSSALFGPYLPDGRYLFLFGCGAAGNPGVSQAQMSISVNGAGASGSDACYTSVANTTSVMIAIAKTLSNGTNTVAAKYRSTDNASTCTFLGRWLLALKYANK